MPDAMAVDVVLGGEANGSGTQSGMLDEHRHLAAVLNCGLHIPWMCMGRQT